MTLPQGRASCRPGRLRVTDFTARAILFDMDGTLVDSTSIVEHMWGEFAAANHVDAAAVVTFAHGRPSRDTIARFAADPQSVSAWLATFATWEEHGFDEVVEIPGARDLVAAVPRGRWAVVTSALRGPALRRLDAAGFPEPTLVVGADDVEHGKPSPEGYLAAAAALGVPPEQCIVFEDTDAGLDAGRAAGCMVVAVGDQARADVRVKDLTQVSLDTVGDQLRLRISPA